MIKIVSIQNYKNIRNATIELDRLTVFVGANASGKTSVLEAIHHAARSSTGKAGRVLDYPRQLDWLYTREGDGDLSITCTTEGGDFALQATPAVAFPPSLNLMDTGRWNLKVTSPEGTILDAERKPARSLVFLHLNAAELAKPSYSTRKVPRIRQNGAGIASVLAFMALNDPDAFDKLIGVMCEFIPQIKRIRFRKTSIKRSETELVRFGDGTVERRTNRSYPGEAILFDFKNANNVAAHIVSEGTLLMLGIMTVLLGPSRPKILLIDDIEHGLHPLAQQNLLVAIKKVMQKFPDLQILATAHSPYLLDQLEPKQVRLMTTGSDGYSICGRLEEHPQFDQWKDEMAPGELWSLFGEKWLAEREAAR